MTRKFNKKTLSQFLLQVMRVQKQFAHEQVGARNDRRNEIKKNLNRIAAELDSGNGN